MRLSVAEGYQTPQRYEQPGRKVQPHVRGRYTYKVSNFVENVGAAQVEGDRYKPEHKGAHHIKCAALLDPFAGRLGGFDS